MRLRPSIASYALAALGTAAALGSCRTLSQAERQEREWQTHGTIRRVVTLLGWTTSGHVLYARQDSYGGGDVWMGSCDSAGVYSLSYDGESKRVHGGNALCVALAAGVVPAIDRALARLVFNNQYDGGRLHVFDLSRRDDTALGDSAWANRCLPAVSASGWSPDGQTIAFVANCLDPDGATQLHLMSVSSGAPHPVSALRDSVQEDCPSWAPDGRQIAISRGSRPWRSRIAVVDTGTAIRRDLVAGWCPKWSPTGEWIAFIRDDSTTYPSGTLQLIRPDGSQERTLVPLDGDTARPRGVVDAVWSADGQRLAVQFARPHSIWGVSVDGSGLRPLIRWP